MIVRGTELDVLNETIGVDRDRGRPASHAVQPGYALLRVLHQRERQSKTLAGFVEGLASASTMECDDEGHFLTGVLQLLQARELRQAWC